jgi:excisionase family DNA binding protein
MREVWLRLEPLLLRATEVGKLLGLGRSKVFAMVAAGQLPAIRIGRSVRVPREALERWVREQTVAVDEGNDAVISMDVRPHLQRRGQTPSRNPLTDCARPFMIPGPGLRKAKHDGETR